MKNLFKSLKVQSYEELTLAANMLRSEWLAQKINWNVAETVENKKDLTFQPENSVHQYYCK